MSSRKTLLSEQMRIDASLKESQFLRGKIGNIPMNRWIQDLRKKLHMSQKQLAKRAKITQSQLSQIETGKTKITISTLEKIFEALFCEIMILPISYDNLDSIVEKQAKLAAKKKLSSIMGTMALEDQIPSKEYLERKIEEVSIDLMRSGTTKIWDL